MNANSFAPQPELDNSGECGMICDSRGRPRPGIAIDKDGRVLLWYRDSFGRLQSKHLMYCTASGVVEWRHQDTTLAIGVLLQNPDGAGHFIRLDVPDYSP